MRWIKNALLVLVTLALVAVGAVMPFAASRLQDAQQAGVEMRPFNSFSLTLREKGDLRQLLRFLAENEYYVMIEGNTEKAVMSRDEVLEAAMETVDTLFRHGIISKDMLAAVKSNEAAGVDPPQVEMACLASELDQENAVFAVWGVGWDNLGLQIWLDDASGKAFHIYYWDRAGYEDYDGKPNASSAGMTKEKLYARMENWSVFLTDYYEMIIQDIQEVPYSYSQNFLIYIDPEDGGGWIPIRLYLHEDGASMIVEASERAE